MYKCLLKGVFVFILLVVLFFYPLNITKVKAFTSFYDNFDRADDTTLGPNWSLFYGNQPAGIENNRAYIDVSAGGYWGFYKVNNLNIQNQDVKITYVHQNGDTTLLARVTDINNRIAINYYQNSGLQIYEVYNGIYRSIPNTAPNAIVGETYTIRALIVNDSLKIWINGTQYVDTVLNHVTSGSAGFGANDGYTRVYFDDFSVEDPSAVTMSPTPSPTPIFTPISTPLPTVTATATSTATPSAPPLISLNVPLLKQFSTPWRDDLYAFTDKTIEELGCALTSASMILKYFGHNINPDELNNWLKSQPDGYIRNTLVNWLAISRYSFLNDSINSPSLEYSREDSSNENILDNLEGGIPSIIKVPGHFVVADSQTVSSFGIKDPGYDKDKLSEYPARFALNKFTPTHTDLSYFMFVIDPDMNLELFDQNNNLVDSQIFTESPIKNLTTGENFGDDLKFLIAPKPEAGSYTLRVNGPAGEYVLDSYLYDTNGNPITNTFTGYIVSTESDNFIINYSNVKTIKPSKISIVGDLVFGLLNNKFKNYGIFRSILVQYNHNQNIKHIINQIKNLTPRLIDPTFSSHLQSNLNALLSQ
jgi:hypothetical protein